MIIKKHYMENNTYSVRMSMLMESKILNVPLIDLMDELGFIPQGDYSQILLCLLYGMRTMEI